MSVLSNAMDAYGTYTKVNDVRESIGVIKETCTSKSLTTPQKVAQCSAEVTFIGARCGELCLSDPHTKPFVNGVATVSDVGRCVIRGCNEQQPVRQVVIESSTKALSGAGETLVNISAVANSTPLAVVGTFFSLAGLGITLYQYFNRPRFQ